MCCLTCTLQHLQCLKLSIFMFVCPYLSVFVCLALIWYLFATFLFFPSFIFFFPLFSLLLTFFFSFLAYFPSFRPPRHHAAATPPPPRCPSVSCCSLLTSRSYPRNFPLSNGFGGQSNTILPNCLQTVIITWQTCELVRWQRHQRHVL
jgi:hypothetical protein